MNYTYNKHKDTTSALENIKLSQNFLTGRRVLERILRRSTITKADKVIEIGTGKGHLTSVLAEKCGYLYTIELDRKLYEYTKQKLQDKKNIQFIYGDFLKYQLPRQGKYKVFANIPYNLTTEIVLKLSKTYQPPMEMWLVMEKGAAKRFMGKPCENKVSLELKQKWNMEIVYYFKQDDFHPKPKVDSVLLHFKLKR